eukprot:13831527-Alexandrium_andersonii.AAC.1
MLGELGAAFLNAQLKQRVFDRPQPDAKPGELWLILKALLRAEGLAEVVLGLRGGPVDQCAAPDPVRGRRRA